jgi:hypothetical protein
VSAVLVSFCCNDDRGNFADVVRELQIGDDIHIACTKERPPVMRREDGKVRVGRCVYRCGSWTSWHGNVFWDAVGMDIDQARYLVRWLLGHGWAVEQYAHEGPFADLAKGRR